MGGSARYRYGKKIKEGKITASDLSFSIFVKKGVEAYPWELDDDDIKVFGFDENGNAYEIDKNGNPTRLAKKDYEKEWTFQESSESDTITELRRRLEDFREEPEDEEDRRWDWWDNGGKERTLYGL